MDSRYSSLEAFPWIPKVAFLGLGWIGWKRLETLVLSKCAEVVALADSNPQCLSRHTQAVPHAVQVNSLEALIEMAPDGIVISTPNAHHVAHATACLEAGIPVFCQKPLGRNFQEVDSIIQCAKQNNLLLDVDLSYRHLSGLKKAQQYIAAGELGDIFAVDLVFHNAYGPDKAWFYDPAISGGGCFLDLGIHLLDIALWVLDSYVESFDGQALCKGQRTVGRGGIDDYAWACLSLSNGASVRLACSWGLHAGQDAVIEFTFFGTKGGISIKNINGSFYDFSSEIYRGRSRCEFVPPDASWQKGAIVRWCHHLQKSPEYRIEIERQYEVARVIDAIYKRNQVSSPPAFA